MHTPVLLQEVIEALNIKPNGLYIDATAGEGGHLIKILKRGGRVLGIDQDENQIKNLGLKVHNPNLKLVSGNYRDIEEIARRNGFYPADGVLFDLGLSMRQIRESGRGFSYKNQEENLDMRLNEGTEFTAEFLVNSLDEQSLYEIFARFSEELNSRTIAQAIIRSRSVRRIKKVGDLTEVIDKAIGRSDEKTYSRIFQALRVAVNNEFENMKKALGGAKNLLKKQGRIAIITFHSLEDRLVKNFIRENNLSVLNKKAVTGSRDLSFERSAKLRVIFKSEKFN